MTTISKRYVAELVNSKFNPFRNKIWEKYPNLLKFMEMSFDNAFFLLMFFFGAGVMHQGTLTMEQIGIFLIGIFLVFQVLDLFMIFLFSRMSKEEIKP